MAKITYPQEVQEARECASYLSAFFDGLLANSLENIQAIDPAPKLLLASPPKTGSTWLSSTVSKVYGVPLLRSYLPPDRNEQEIDSALCAQTIGSSVLFGQQHVKASETLLKICKLMNIRVVVLTRDIKDCLVSFRDHIYNESSICSMFYIDRDTFVRWSQSRQYDFLIDHALPWYISFLTGWRAAAAGPFRGSIMTVTYETLLRRHDDVIATIGRFARFLPMDSRARITLDLDTSAATRLNKGVVGRGADAFSARQNQRISDLISYGATPSTEILHE